MEYQVEIDILKPASLCYDAYTKIDHIKKWMPNLNEIIHTKGHLFEANSIGFFEFNQMGKKMLMEVEVLDMKEPYGITMIYRVPGAKNTCINHFNDKNGHTQWIMDVIFEFDEDPNLDLEIFKKSTRMSMEVLKNYLEGQNDE